ncbi:alpha/beta fold hydrolase [Skermania sp. ID1734]|uniref:PHA/PHB synthase family protein n=1 Tax=Skermania sp. ID1734 TaxID=2597516 RepID=UPI00117F8746|nr:alpha/beta fold hydrolase [Skermania sp. ID1734]TSD94072.1 alpha/beta fold hydrolase [Skermania sp. ID1734]
MFEKAVQAAEAVGFIDDPDTALFGRAVASAVLGVARHPFKGTELTYRVGSELIGTALVTVNRSLGLSTPGPMAIDPKDRRFTDPTWEDNPAYYAIRQAYLALRQYALGSAEAAQLDPVAARKAHVALEFLADALAPTNFLLTNPAALKRAFETGGRSVVSGLWNFADDVLHNNGRPQQVDRTPFEVGRNLAATPSRVVHRNDLIEVLQYLPQTEQVHQIPILCSPPWINKYYIMDLAPGRSFIEWAVQHGHTVFAISYRNPDRTMADTTMDDYLIQGLGTALDVVCDITGSAKVHVVGLCLGGAMTMMTAAYLASAGDDRIGAITLLNAMVDFAEPGPLGTFTDPSTVAILEKKMARKGYLDGTEMSGTFDMLRPNDLIFNYVVSNWLMGQSPPAFDLLAWNADSTRMPARMHAFYLRACYVENRFVAGELELAGRRLHLGDLSQPLYIVAAVNDHIVPWKSSYATTDYVGGPVRFVLSSGGHIAGVVNPPNPKAWYMTSDETPAAPEEWRAGAEKHPGSWWDDWAVWSAERGGQMVDPPPVGGAEHRVLGEGPGEYVRLQ